MADQQVWLVTLARPGFEGRAATLARSALETGGIDRAVVWDWERLARLGLLTAHPGWLAERDRDLELWKPALIEAQLGEIPAGDMLLFHEAGSGYWGDHSLQTSVRLLVEWALENNDGVLPGVWVPELGRNLRWTTRRCFRRMGCDGEAYWNSPQLQTTYSLWRHDRDTRDLLQSWHASCALVYDADRDRQEEPDSEFRDFTADRGSQSVLTNLAISLNLRSFGEPHETTTAINHPAAEPVPATDIENLLARIALECPAPLLSADARTSGGRAVRRALFTSIPPKSDRQSSHAIPIGEAYQRRCIASWKACGFEIYSVHYRDEAAFDPPFDGVTRIDVERAGDDRPGEFKPTLEAILGAVRQVEADVCGIINADILLCEDRTWVDALDGEVAGSVVVFTRLETNDVDRQVIGGPPWGFDLVFFDRDYLANLTYCGMRLGECWWDYWLPLALVFAGAELKNVRDPVCLHQVHLNASFARFHEFGRRFHAWLMDGGGDQDESAHLPEKGRFAEYCNHRMKLGLDASRARALTEDEFLNEVFCITVWAGLCRLMRRRPIELIAKSSPHHRLMMNYLLRAIDFIEQDKVDRARAGEPRAAHDLVLLELEREFTRFTPVWEERLVERAGSPVPPGRSLTAGARTGNQSDRVEAMVRGAGAVHTFWPVRIDLAIRNLFRRFRRKPRFVPPEINDPWAAIAWIRQLRKRPLSRYLARLDGAIWSLRLRSWRS